MPIDPSNPESQSGETANNPQDSPSVEEVISRLDRLWDDQTPELAGPFASLAGTRVGPYVIERIIGRGAFGVVYKATDHQLNRDVAMKIPRPEVLLDHDTLRRFESEARATAQLDHPGIVPLYEAEMSGATPFLASAFCAGPNLQQWLDESPKPQPAVDAARFVAKLAAAVQYAHEQGIVHRDLKPSNILLVPIESRGTDSNSLSSLEPRLTDFGLSRFTDSALAATRSSVRLGTPLYMSPEQAIGKSESHGPATDVYSLGVVLYELISGHLPFIGSSEFEIVNKMMNSEPVAPSRREEGIPPDLSSICLKCLEASPAQRYSTARELRDDLLRFVRGEPTVARPIPPARRLIRWSRRKPALAGLLFVSIMAIALTAAGLAIHLQTVTRNARELSTALATSLEARDDARRAEEIALSQRELARKISYRSDMRLAYELWDRGQIPAVQKILQRQHAPNSRDLRGPEWYVLDTELQETYLEIGRHEGAITECVMTPDRQKVYTAGVDGLVRAWDLSSRVETNCFTPNIGQLHALALSPDGSAIAVGGEPRMPEDIAHVMTMDSATGDIHSSVQSHVTTIESIAFSPDGKWLAAGSRYHPVQLTRLSDEKHFNLESDQRNREVSFSSDSQFLAVSADESHVMIWRLGEGEPERLNTIQSVEDGHPYLSCFVPELPLLATSFTNNNLLAIFDADQGFIRALAKGTRLSPSYACMGFSPDSTILAAGDDSGNISLWHPDARRLHRDDVRWNNSSQRLEPVAGAAPHVSRVTSVIVSDDSTVISCGEDGRLTRSAPFASGAVHRHWQFSITATAMAGDELLLGCSDGIVRRHIIEKKTPETQRAGTPQSDIPEVLFQSAEPVESLAVSPDGTVVAVGSVNGGLVLINRNTGEVIERLINETAGTSGSSIRSIAFSSDGNMIAHTGNSGLVKVLDTKTGQELFSKDVGAGWTVTFLPHDKHLACGGRLEGIRVFDVQTGALVRTISGEGTDSLQCSHNGKLLASVHLNGTVQIMDIERGGTPIVASGHRAFGESTAFSFNDRTVVSLDLNHTIQFTDVESGLVLGQLAIENRMGPLGDDFCSVHCNRKFLTAVVAGIEEASSHLSVWHVE